MKSDWNEKKVILKEKLDQLTDHLSFPIIDKHDELLSRLQVKVGKTREALRKLLAKLKSPTQSTEKILNHRKVRSLRTVLLLQNEVQFPTRDLCISPPES